MVASQAGEAEEVRAVAPLERSTCDRPRLQSVAPAARAVVAAERVAVVAGGGGGFFGGGRAGNLVEPGDYLVTINAGGQTMRQVVHVERVGEILNVDFGPDEDVDGDDEPNDP